MIEIITEINGSKLIASRELKNSGGVHEVLCEDMTVHITDGAIDDALPSIESVAVKINIKYPIMTGNMRLR